MCIEAMSVAAQSFHGLTPQPPTATEGSQRSGPPRIHLPECFGQLLEALIFKSFPAGLRLSGVPAQEHRQYLREQATLRRLAQQQDLDASSATAGQGAIASSRSDKGDTKDG